MEIHSLLGAKAVQDLPKVIQVEDRVPTASEVHFLVPGFWSWGPPTALDGQQGAHAQPRMGWAVNGGATILSEND